MKQGWVSPNGKFFPLQKNKVIEMYENHDVAARRLLRKFYPKWDWENIPSREAAHWYASIALYTKGWIRVASDGQYSAWSLKDPFTGRMRRNLIDLVSSVDGGKIYIDTEVGDVIGGEYSGDILDKYQ